MADYSLDYTIHYEGNDSCAISFGCFDTANTVTVHELDRFQKDPEQVLLAARHTCLHLHELWSFTLPESNIARLNQPCESIEVDALTIELIESMQQFKAIEPLFDFTIGPASFLWKQAFIARAVPTDAEIAEALTHVGADHIGISGQTVNKDDPLTSIDVGGAAKGFAADLLAAQLRAAGATSADVDLGGNLYLVGNHPEGRPWRLELTVPMDIDANPGLVEVSDASAVTSGTYERFAEIGGRFFHHIIDPTTGWPAQSDIASVTVIGSSSLQADMLAPTCLIAGSAGMRDLARRHPGYRFVAITTGGYVIDVGA